MEETRWQLFGCNKITYVVYCSQERVDSILRFRGDIPVNFTKVDDNKIVVIRAGKINLMEEL